MTKVKWLMWDTLRIIVGSLLYVVGLECFAVPNGFVLGGVGGIATVLNILKNVPIGITAAVLNLLVLIIGVWRLGTGATLRTCYATVWFTLALSVGERLFHYTYDGEPLLAAVLGGTVMGVGLILVYSCDCTTGGSDLLAKVLAMTRPRWSFGRWVLLVDSAVVILGSLALRSPENTVYSVIMILFCTRVFEAYFAGKNTAKVALIVTDQSDAVRSFLVERLGRGCTEIEGVGGYTRLQKRILYCALSDRQIGALRQFCGQKCPDTFVAILGAEIWGKGFGRL